MRRVVVALLAIMFIGAAIAAAGVAFLQAEYKRAGPGAEATTLLLPRGTGLAETGRLLASEGLVRHHWVFTAGARLNGRGRHLRAGEYSIPAAASPAELFEILASGKTILRRVTVPEGLTNQQIAEIIRATDGLNGEIEKLPQEGRLLPETYHYSFGDTRQGLIDRMQAALDKELAKHWAEKQENLPLDSPLEALILASIVEKETGVAAERPRVAAVFINRLRKGMRLQSDPTVVYGITGGTGPLDRPLSRADLKNWSAFNTYQIDGLPPQPIANPGVASIAAVVNPLKTSELYFVADGTGGHAFAKTLKQHNNNVRKWRRIQRQKAQ